MSATPDPKPARRESDSVAVKRFRLINDSCVARGCSNVRLSVHHVLYGRDGRHDDPRNFVMLCGHGTAGCHGLFHAADEETRRRIGKAIAARPDTVAFVKERLGEEQGRDYILRRYLVDVG